MDIDLAIKIEQEMIKRMKKLKKNQIHIFRQLENNMEKKNMKKLKANSTLYGNHYR